ncbi:hypothetical protein BIZ38_18495 [Pseudoalteromonas sp. BZK2]|uniref:hypothetical protein n=1 Tax=Pseudoalteromonas sp. BZK2 TaxID=1904458 RepID=UPI001653FF50|nr:hypothetical protein [Pseudoalteromonas sp. BZK2]MBC7010438.1 hypothetical protein [Pseudoalteromonas sp. BZK2]
MFKILFSTLVSIIYFLLIYFLSFLNTSFQVIEWLSFGAVSVAFLYCLYRAIDCGSDRDNIELKEHLKLNSKVIVSHKGSTKSIDAIINNKILFPHDVKKDGPIQYLLPKKFLRKIDHDKDAIWVFLDTPKDTFDFLQGVLNPFKWNKAITFEVPAKMIEIPKGVTKKAFGKHQLVITRPVTLSGDEKVYIKKNFKWVEYPTSK